MPTIGYTVEFPPKVVYITWNAISDDLKSIFCGKCPHVPTWKACHAHTCSSPTSTFLFIPFTPFTLFLKETWLCTIIYISITACVPKSCMKFCLWCYVCKYILYIIAGTIQGSTSPQSQDICHQDNTSTCTHIVHTHTLAVHFWSQIEVLIL